MSFTVDSFLFPGFNNYSPTWRVPGCLLLLVTRRGIMWIFKCQGQCLINCVKRPCSRLIFISYGFLHLSSFVVHPQVLVHEIFAPSLTLFYCDILPTKYQHWTCAYFNILNKSRTPRIPPPPRYQPLGVNRASGEMV